MSGYQRLPEPTNNNPMDYPGNAPPAYPTIDYNTNSNNQRNHNQNNNPQNYAQPLLQHEQQQQQQMPSPYAHSQPQPQGTYAVMPQQQQSPEQSSYPYYQQPQAVYGQPQPQAIYGQPQQPMYNAYGYPSYPATVATVGYVQPALIQPGVPGHLPRGAWSDGICDCFTHIPSCIVGCFVPCVLWAQTMKRANLMSFWGAFFLYTIPAAAVFAIGMYFNILSAGGTDWDSNYNSGGGGVTYDSGVFIALYSVMIVANFFVIILTTIFRGKLREKYQINGASCVEDFCLNCCCGNLTRIQEYKHVSKDLGLLV